MAARAARGGISRTGGQARPARRRSGGLACWRDPNLLYTIYTATPTLTRVTLTSQVLIWDLFVGRAIWLDALERGTPFSWAALLLTNGIGPPGMLLYVLLCLGSGRGLPTLGYQPQEE